MAFCRKAIDRSLGRAYSKSMVKTENVLIEALQGLSDSAGRPLPQSPYLAGVHFKDGRASVALNLDGQTAETLAQLRADIEARLQAVPGVERVLVTLTSEKSGAQARPQAPRLANVKKVLAVASGKGGVGKSTTAANLALALAARGLKTGLLDADIYGPSVPHLFALITPPDKNDDGKIEPVITHGIKVMSIGLMVEKNMPLIWRGPMIDKVLNQFLHDVEWGELDVLVIDMPPGTGDAQISLTRRLCIDGAVIVSTPQDLSLIDARKGVALFQETGVPVIGLIENMSMFICPHCGTRCDIFSHGGAEKEASVLGLPFLGAIPLHMSIRKSADAGAPLVAHAPQSVEAQVYIQIADRIWAALKSAAADAAIGKA